MSLDGFDFIIYMMRQGLGLVFFQYAYGFVSKAVLKRSAAIGLPLAMATALK